MIVFGNGTHVDWDFRVGHGKTSDLRSEIRSWKHFEPSSLLAREYTAALMRVTLKGFLRFTSGTGFGMSRTGSRISGAGSGMSARGVNNRSVSTEGELLDSGCDGCWKMMLPNTQSIKRL